MGHRALPFVISSAARNVPIGRKPDVEYRVFGCLINNAHFRPICVQGQNGISPCQFAW